MPSPDDRPLSDLTDRPHTGLVFLCPLCECQLDYTGSRPGSDSSAALDFTDYFSCPAGCGTFEHERRTHRLRQVR